MRAGRCSTSVTVTQASTHYCLNLVLMQAFGFLWAGPSNHYWQKFLEKLFKGRRDGATVVQKVI